MRMMKIFTLLTMAYLTSSRVFGLSCEDRALSEYDGKMNLAKEAFESELGLCFTLPFGEKFEKCRYLADQNYKKEVKDINGALFRAKKSCMHDHTEYDLNNM